MKGARAKEEGFKGKGRGGSRGLPGEEKRTYWERLKDVVWGRWAKCAGKGWPSITKGDSPCELKKD